MTKTFTTNFICFEETVPSDCRSSSSSRRDVIPEIVELEKVREEIEINVEKER